MLKITTSVRMVVKYHCQACQGLSTLTTLNRVFVVLESILLPTNLQVPISVL